VKANAYGHGLAELAPILEADERVDAFCVVNIDEAELLRSIGILKPIVTIGHFDPHAANAAVRLNVVPFVFTRESISALEREAAALSKKVRVVLKLDTGMGRLGVRLEELPSIVEFVKAQPRLELAGFATHFAQSDSEDRSHTLLQKQRFADVLQLWSGSLSKPFMNSASNSGGILTHSDAHYDLARFGIGLYGLHPSKHTAEVSVRLSPVLEYKAKVIHIQNLKKGDSVSYGSTWTAESDARIAVLPVGYSDGYLRAYARGAKALINGVRCPIRGRVCMNYAMFDVSKLENVQLGDTATLISSDPDSGCAADDLAEIAGTINYEVTTILPESLERVVVD
jgi:alanine racemase